jgi:hypothetical protein
MTRRKYPIKNSKLFPTSRRQGNERRGQKAHQSFIAWKIKGESLLKSSGIELSPQSQETNKNQVNQSQKFCFLSEQMSSSVIKHKKTKNTQVNQK